MRPRFCNYYVTLRCNAKCRFCNIWQKGANARCREQTIVEIDSNLRDLKKLGVKLVDFTGGEPLLYPHLIDALQLAKRYGLFTTVTTNCLLYPRYAAELKGIVDILQFSLDAADEDTHDAVRGVRCYRRVIESIALAKQLHQKVYLLFTLTDENYSSLAGMVKFAQENHCILAINPCFEYFGNRSVSRAVVSRAGRYFYEPYVVMDLASLKLIKDGGNKVEQPVCRAISSTIVISPDNKLFLPCYHHCFKALKIEANLRALYNSDEVKRLKRLDGRFNVCKNCTIYCYMRGSLYQHIFSRYGYLTALSAIKYMVEMLRPQY